MAGAKSFTRPTLSVSPRYTSSMYCSRVKKHPRMVMFAPETMWSWISPANGWPSCKSKRKKQSQTSSHSFQFVTMFLEATLIKSFRIKARLSTPCSPLETGLTITRPEVTLASTFASRLLSYGKSISSSFSSTSRPFPTTIWFWLLSWFLAFMQKFGLAAVSCVLVFCSLVLCFCVFTHFWPCSSVNQSSI